MIPGSASRHRKFMLLLAIVVAAALYPIFFGQFYITGDMRDVFIPLENFFQQEQLAGRLPAWHPDIAWGYPVIAAAQIGFFYPPLLLLRVLPLQIYLPILLLGSVIAMAWGTYKFFRLQKLTPAGAYIGSISFTLGSFMIQHLTHLNIIITAAWLPWQLLAAHYAVSNKGSRSKRVAVLALAIGIPFLAGQLHIPTLMALVTSIYFIYLQIRQGKKIIKPIATIIIVGLLAASIAAAQLIPTAELMGQSSRGPGGEFNVAQANQHSFPLYHLPTTIFPRFFGNDDTYWGKRLQIEYGIFIGTIPLILALWAVAKAKRNSFWLWLLIISFLLALGSLSPFRLIGLEPSLWVFSAPARWLFFTTFALALFAGRGFDYLASQPAALIRLAKRLTFIFIAIVVLGTVALFTINEQQTFNLIPESFLNDAGRPLDYYTAKIQSLLSSARQSSLSLASPFTLLPIISIASLLLVTKKRFGLKFLLAVATIELIIIAATTNPIFPWSALNPPTSIVDLPTSVTTGQARLLSIRRPGDTGLYLTNPNTRANTVLREEYRQLLIPLSHTQFDLPGVEWPASLDLAGHAAKLDIIRSAVSFTPAQQANIGAIISSSEADPPSFSIQSLDPHPRASIKLGTADYQLISPTHTRIQVDTPLAAELLIRDSFYPGWQVTIDGQVADLQRAEEIWRGLTVPAGQHVIDLRYYPKQIYFGLTISVIALVICGILILKPKNI